MEWTEITTHITIKQSDSNGKRTESLAACPDELDEVDGKMNERDERSKEKALDKYMGVYGYIDDFAGALKDKTSLVIKEYKQRMDIEKKDFERGANERIIIKLLNPLDNLDRALDVLKQKKNDKEEFIENIIKGIEATQKELYKVLESEGVEIIGILGEELDLDKHELMSIKIGEKDDIVVGIEEKGCRFKNSKVLKYAKVVVSRKEVETTKNFEGDKNG